MFPLDQHPFAWSYNRQSVILSTSMSSPHRYEQSIQSIQFISSIALKNQFQANVMVMSITNTSCLTMIVARFHPRGHQDCGKVKRVIEIKKYEHALK